MLRPRLLLAVLAIALGGWQSWKTRPQAQPPGVLVHENPRQELLEEPAAALTMGRFALHPRAQYALSARLLSRERYHLDTGAALAPLDFALGWGVMSDSAVLEQLEVHQSGRFFHLRWQEPPVPEGEMMGHAANVHLIPADSEVRRALDRMRPGQIVQLRGKLVDAVRDDGWRWSTSLSRSDTGDGACELMLVESAGLR